ATPTATRTPLPTNTPTPGPGAVLFDLAKDKCDWQPLGWNENTGVADTDFTVDAQPERLYIEIPRTDTTGYAVCNQDFRTDVQIDADVQKTTGPNRNNVSLVCRQKSTSWYEAAIDNGGFWYLYKYTLKKGFKEMAHGASTAIHLQNASNHLTLVCAGD